ncbi:hypothetical protein HQ585_20215 [candidate division KSB1 bacterium]|nr:hypothetical protein [candidate division KSB1 bacterium]
MYKYKCLIFILMIILSFLFCKSEDPNSPSDEKFVIQVDSIQVESEINLNDTLSVKFWGIIGPDLCYGFHHFEVHTEPHQIYFTLWGFHTNDDICATALSELRGKEYNFKPQNKGTLLITVHQPDNSVLIDSVLVL